MAEQARAKGNAAYRASNFGAAVRHFSDAIGLSPGDHLLYCNRSAAYAALNQHRLALEDAARAYDLNPDFPRAYSRLGNAHLGLGRLGPALCAFNFGLGICPDDADLKTGYWRAALRVEDAAKPQEEDRFLQAPETLDALRADLSAKNFAYRPGFSTTLMEVGYNVEEYITKIDPERETSYEDVAAEALMKLKFGNERLEALQETQRIEHKFSPGIFENSDRAESVERATVGLRDYCTVRLQSNPEDPELYSTRSMYNTKLGNFHDGLKDAEKCIELDPCLWIGYHRKGQVLFCTKESDAAVDTYMLGLDRTQKNGELLEAFKLSMAEEARAKGNAAYRASNFGAAVRHYSDAIGLSPNDHLLYSNRSAAYASLNQHRLALEDAVKTYELRPEFPRAYLRLGNAHLGLGRLGQALCAFNLGLKIIPGDANLMSGYERAAARAEETLKTLEDDRLLQSPDTLKALEAHLSIKNFATRPGFWKMLIGVAEDHHSSDRRFLHALGDLMKVKCRSPSPLEGGSLQMETTQNPRIIDEEWENEVEVKKKFKAEIKNYITKIDVDGTIDEQKKDTPKLDREDKKWEPLRQHILQASPKHLINKIFENFNRANMAPLNGDESEKRANVESMRDYFTVRLQRNPEDPELYSERSMCHTELGNFHDALKDAEKCIQLDPCVWIGYHIKGQVLFCMKESGEAVDTYLLGLDRTQKNGELLQAFKDFISELTGLGTGDGQ